MAEAATSLGSLMSNTKALRGKAAVRYGAPTEPFGSLTTIQSLSSASANLESATRETKQRIPSSHACLWASAITKFLLRRLFGRASEWKSPKSLPTRGSFHNLPPAMSPIMEASHVLPLRPVPKIHTNRPALSSPMSSIVADGAGNGKVPKGCLRRVSEPGLPALPRYYRIEVMQDAERELLRACYELGQSRIGMWISRSAWFPRDLCF